MKRFYSKASPSAVIQPQRIEESVKAMNMKIDLENHPSDPGLRPNIMSYPPNLIEQVRRVYLLEA
ncbi:hypothetical protein OROGR_016534 [Orobanche gracilis]